MEQKFKIIISASAASILAFSALAQDTPKLNVDQRDHTLDRLVRPQAERPNGAAKASDLIGMTVKNYHDEKLGTVEDLAVDVESGRIVQVILSVGGLFGIGDTLTAVPPGALHLDVAHKVLHLDANKEKLQQAPKFETAKWIECCNSNHLSAVYGHYGQENAFTFIRSDDAVLDRQGNRVPSSKADVTRGRNLKSAKSQSMIPASRLGQIQQASKLMGTGVKNLQDESLGNVDNVLVDLPAGRVVAIIVSSGGFLGIGDALSAVPPTAFRYSADRETLQLDASKEMLSSAPHFKANQWPDFDQPGYADEVYRAYQVEPYFATNAVAALDQTSARNVREQIVRDQNVRTLTPLDQGNSKVDLATTAQIRKEIIAGKNMSVNARNVKVITNKGQVTLRGPVNTAEEKRLIGEIAGKVARLENVDNQLEVR